MSTNNAAIATFDTHTEAELAIKELQKSGFDMKKLSIIGKGYHSEEHPVGFYATGDRVKSWGGIGAFWGSIWGLLVGSAFVWVPGIGPLGIAGPFAHLLVTALEGAAVAGGVGALGAVLTSLGVPKNSIVKYETQLRADKFLLIAHGSAAEVEQARSILQRAHAAQVDAVAA